MVGGVKAADSCDGNSFYVKGASGESYACANTLSEALSSVKSGEEIVLLKDFTPGSALTITKDITIDLNGNTLKIASQDLTVKGANVTIKNGTIDVSNDKKIDVNSSEKASTLTIADDVVVKDANSTTNAVIQSSNSSKETVININGTWKNITGEIVACDKGDKLTINLNANVTSNLSEGALVSLDGGTSVVNVNGGTYDSNKNAFILKKGTLNINAGTIKAVSHAILVQSTNADESALNIAGGDITATATNRYSLMFGGAAGNTNATYAITGGTFTSGKDSDGNQLPAIGINDPTFLENHPAIISKGTFNGGIVGDITIGGKRYEYAASATKKLVTEGTPMITENGQVVVGEGTSEEQSEEQNTPTAPERQETTGNTADAKNPGTSDNFMSLVSLVSASAAGLFIAL